MLRQMIDTLGGKTTVCLALAVATCSFTFAQSPGETALSFYSEGGWFCFRVVPLGVTPSRETQWTMMLLTSKSNRKNTFKIEVGHPSKTGFALAVPWIAVADQVWRSDTERADFFRKFADGISAGRMRARVVKAGPTNLSQLASDGERAEAYKKFTESRPNISFEKVPDLKPEEFASYVNSFRN